VDSYIGEKQD